MKIDYKLLISDPAHFIALGFGAGLTPKLPGTAGTLLALPIYLLMQDLSVPIYLAVVGLFAVIGVWAAGRSARLSGISDPAEIVIDEIVGMLLALTMLPSGWLWLGIGFLLFRLFDIMKPWPICLIDRKIHGGIGIMLDDLLAGVYTFLVIQMLVALPSVN